LAGFFVFIAEPEPESGEQNMSKKTPSTEPLSSEVAGPSRRRMLEIMGTAAIAVPVLGLSACGGDSGDSGGSASSGAPAAAKDSMKAMQSDVEEATESMASAADDMADDMAEKTEEMADAAEDMVEEASAAVEEKADMIASDAMAKVDEGGPQAIGLGYRHDATTVDAKTQTRYQAGQQCSNCALFQGGDAEWGGCPLFAGQMVKSTGWCSAYAPTA
jgi:ElaB/YqjD/DUF883 family membrane-anchored ribosome-binding protein